MLAIRNSFRYSIASKRLVNKKIGKRFSSDSKTKPEEDNSILDMFPRFKKSLPITIPMFFCSTFVGMLFWDKEFRKLIEGHFPSFVEYLRSNYKFKDEDELELFVNRRDQAEQTKGNIM